MSVSGIHGQVLEVTVVACNNLKDTEWISRQDPYVCVEYCNTKFRTRTCTDGGKNPTFQEKFAFTLIEGLREINIVVRNSNTLALDSFIGSGKVQLQKVLSQGYDDTPWPLQSKRGRYAGEVRLILHYANANKPATNCPPTTPLYGAPPTAYYPPPSPGYPPSSPYPSYQPPTYAYSPPPQYTAYPPQQYPTYPPQPYSTYPPAQYLPPPQASPYPPSPYGIYPQPPY